MKTLNRIFLLTLLAVAAITLNSYAGDSDKTENRKVSGFDGIKVSTGIDLFITMGETEQVKVVAADEIIDNLVTEVKEGTLRIYMKRTEWFNWGGFNKTRKVYVTAKELNSIDASSGSDVKSENTLKGESIEIEASSGSDVELDLVYKTVSVKTSSGSDAKLTGKTKNLEASASSGSDIMARDLESQNCNVHASSGSDATVNVTESLVAKASSGADIRYYGNPGMRDTDESSGGDVSRK